ncbi:MAG: hypothetical protein RIQ93_3010 [Verrucomicrobiota bacterium]
MQGFIDKNTSTVAALKTAIRAVAEGRVTFSESFLRTKAARIANPHSFDKLLTDRERTLLSLVGRPLTDGEIASLLAISHETVEKHRFNLRRKLSLGTTTELVRYAQEHGFVLSPPASFGGQKPV